jgi:hypothetical protein
MTVTGSVSHVTSGVAAEAVCHAWHHEACLKICGADLGRADVDARALTLTATSMSDSTVERGPALSTRIFVEEAPESSTPRSAVLNMAFVIVDVDLIVDPER